MRAAPPHGEPFEDFRAQNEQRNHERGEHFPDSRRGHDGDGHGKLHSHAALHDIFVGLVKDGIAAGQSANRADHVQVGNGRPPQEPNQGRRRAATNKTRPISTQFRAWD